MDIKLITTAPFQFFTASKPSSTITISFRNQLNSTNMFSFKSISILVASLATIATAVPTVQGTNDWILTEGTGIPHSDIIEKRGTATAGGVYICTDVDWKVRCLT
jgi:hypothetical protein